MTPKERVVLLNKAIHALDRASWALRHADRAELAAALGQADAFCLAVGLQGHPPAMGRWVREPRAVAGERIWFWRQWCVKHLKEAAQTARRSA